jgi:hypothetical protein
MKSIIESKSESRHPTSPIGCMRVLIGAATAEGSLSESVDEDARESNTRNWRIIVMPRPACRQSALKNREIVARLSALASWQTQVCMMHQTQTWFINPGRLNRAVIWANRCAIESDLRRRNVAAPKARAIL